MADTDWAELSVAEKKVAKFRANFAELEFTLSGEADAAWVESFENAVAGDERTAGMEGNPGPAPGRMAIVWNVVGDDIETAWKIVKDAVAQANSEFAVVHAAQVKREEEMQARMGAGESKRAELDKKLQALK